MSLAGIPYVPTFGHVGETLQQLAPQIAAQYAHVVWEAIQNAARSAKTEMVLLDTRLDLSMAMAREALARYEALPAPLGPSQEAPKTWGSLGDIEFSLLTAPNSMDVTEGVVYARQALVGAKPRLQFTGFELQEIRLGISWHHLVQPDIEAQLGALLKAMRERTVLDLVIGETEDTGIYAGDYVIQRIPHQVTRHLADGSIGQVELTLELLEWVDDPELVIGIPAPAIKKTSTLSPAQAAQAKTGGE